MWLGGDHAMLTEVDDLNWGQFALLNAARKLQKAIPAAPRVGVRLHRRRGRTQHYRTVCKASQRNRQVSRMITDTLLLFVGCIVLFVDHDQSERIDRAENGRTWTNHYSCSTL